MPSLKNYLLIIAPGAPKGPMAPAVPLGPVRKELRHYPQIKLKNLQWQKLDARGVNNTVWVLNGVNENEIEDDLDKFGVFEKIVTLFPAKANNFFEKRIKAKVEEKKDAIKFMSKDKSRNISKVKKICKIRLFIYVLFFFFFFRSSYLAQM